jgi:hypothetical protein
VAARDRGFRGFGWLTTAAWPSWGWACTPGGSGAATSWSTGSPRHATPSPMPGCRGPTSSSCRVPTRSATATPASSPEPRSPRHWGGRAPACRAPMRRARPVPPPSRRRGPRSWPVCATSPSWSGPTPPPRDSSPRSGANGKTTPTGCASICSAPPIPRTSPCTRAGAWSSSAPPRTTSPRSRSRTRAPGLPTPTPATAKR